MSVRLYFRMEQLVSRWNDIHEIVFLRGFLKSLKKIQISLKSDMPIYVHL